MAGCVLLPAGRCTTSATYCQKRALLAILRGLNDATNTQHLHRYHFSNNQAAALRCISSGYPTLSNTLFLSCKPTTERGIGYVRRFSDRSPPPRKVAVGDRAVRRIQLTRQIVDQFARLSGDTNPIHMDSAAARPHVTSQWEERTPGTCVVDSVDELATRGGRKEGGDNADAGTTGNESTASDADKCSRVSDQSPVVVHGAFLNGLVAAVIGTELPGPGTIVLCQTLIFPAVCRSDDLVEVAVTLTQVRKVIGVKFEVSVPGRGDVVVLRGTAKLMRKGS